MFQKLSNAKRGQQSEQLAEDYLTSAGVNVVAKNYATRAGEIDLIAEQDRVLLFVEVRYRKTNQFGGALMSVTPSKQRKITLTAQHFLQQHPQFKRHHCRFDVIGLNAAGDIQWIKGAFEAIT